MTFLLVLSWVPFGEVLNSEDGITTVSSRYHPNCWVGRDCYLQGKAKDLRFEHGGAKHVSCPGRHLTSLRPCRRLFVPLGKEHRNQVQTKLNWNFTPSVVTELPLTDRHFYLIFEKVRCQGEEIDRKVYELPSSESVRWGSANGRSSQFTQMAVWYMDKKTPLASLSTTHIFGK